MTREEILKDPEVAHYCDQKRGWIHEAFMDGVDYAERKMKSQIKWQTGEPEEEICHLITLKTGIVIPAIWSQKEGWHSENNLFRFYNVIAWCKLSDIKPYKP